MGGSPFQSALVEVFDRAEVTIAGKTIRKGGYRPFAAS